MSGALCGDKVAYFDCFSGISGDMILGALIDCGLELRRLQELLSGLKLSGYRLEAKKVSRYGLAGTDVQVVIEHDSPAAPPARNQRNDPAKRSSRAGQGK